MNDIVRQYLLKKNKGLPGIPPLEFPPIGPSSFDVNESSSPSAMKGALPAPAVAPPQFKLTMDDITRPSITDQLLNPPPPVETPQMAAVEPEPAPAPAPMAEPETTPMAPVATQPTPPTPEEANPMKGSLSVVAKALAGLADARNAGIGQKSEFLSGISQGERQSEADRRAKIEFDRKEALEKEKDDPNSAYSQALQAVGKKVFPKGDFSKSTGRQLETTLQPYLKLFDIEKEAENRKATVEAARLAREQAREERLGAKEEDRIQSVRKEISGSKSYQGWLDIKNASDNLNEAVANIAAGGPRAKRTIGAVYSYVKALDPGSVVREGEIRLAGEARSLATKLESTFRKLTTGETMTPAEIKELADWAQEKEKLARKTAIASNKPAIEQATRLGFNLAEVNSDLFGGGASKGGGNPNEVRRKTADGRIIVYDAVTKKPLREEKL